VGAVSLAEPDVTPEGPLEQVLHDYAGYLVHERALTVGVVRQYRDSARRFLDSCFAQSLVRLDQLVAQDAITFLLDYSRHYSVGTSKLMATALRSFLRYLHVEGLVTDDLSGAVPAVAGWRLVGLPKGLDDVEVKRLLRTCDRRTYLGRRSYALLLLMVRLGLRQCEAAALTLDDIDWLHGEITVRGKGREEHLPLPPDVGEALARYLRSIRPHPLDQRHVFPRIHAPHGPLSNGGIGAIVGKHLRQAGVHPPQSHRLRHTAATQMLRHGASLDNIAQVLRHRSHDTTAIYAKVDRQALKAVEQPWPGGVS
jgi:site-specific recombinase XerD